jgi:hypothetical protein
MSLWAKIMVIFTIGFIFIMIFTLTVGIAAMIFLSFDAESNEKPHFLSEPDTQNLYDIVRRINTETIETVDSAGLAQQWTRSGQ